MSSLALRALFRKGGTTSSILAIAFLAAVLSSVHSITNYINLQTETLGKLVYPGETCLILSRNSTSITDSQVDEEIAFKLGNLTHVQHVVLQKVLKATLTTNAGSRTIHVRCVEDVGGFLERFGAYLNGTTPKSWAETDAGEVLARAFSISIGDEIGLEVGGEHVKLKVVGVFRSQTQSDAELIVSMETAKMLTGNSNTVSLIEFSLKGDVDSREVLSQITQLLPENVKLARAQQMKEFMQQINMQTLAFLNVWSLAVYAVVAAASYIIATRLVVESSYEFAMLRALGAKKHFTFTLVLTYTTAVAFLGSILGVALGLAGVQTASAMLRWIFPSVNLAPFIEARQAAQIVLLTLISSILGCTYPAFRSSRERYVEQPL